jgi:hypothetical protein
VLNEITILIPVHTEIIWLKSILPNIRKLLTLGATVVIGLNLKEGLHFEKTQFDSSVTYLEFDRVLPADEHWTELLKHVETPFFRYWFAGDYLSTSAIISHIEELNKDQQLSFIFSSRHAKYRNISIPFEFSKRIKYWGKQKKRIGFEEFLTSISISGTNYIGEPSFVTFRKSKSASIWNSEFGYAIELDFYLRTIQIGNALWVPMDAGSFGVTMNSGTYLLLERQLQDVISWITNVSIVNAYPVGDLRNIERVYRKRRRLLFFLSLFETRYRG